MGQAHDEPQKEEDPPRWVRTTTTAISVVVPMLEAATPVLVAEGTTTWAAITQVVANILRSAAALLASRFGS